MQSDSFALKIDPVVCVWRAGETVGPKGGDDKGTGHSGLGGQGRTPETFGSQSPQGLKVSSLWLRPEHRELEA